MVSLVLFGGLASSEVQDFRRNLLLTALVVLQSKFGKQVLCIVSCRLHGNRAGRMFRRRAVKERRVKFQFQCTGKQGLQKFPGRWLQDGLGYPVGGGYD